MTDDMTAAALPKPAKNTSREELANKFERLRANYKKHWLVEDTKAFEDFCFANSDEISAVLRLAAKPADDGVREALRPFADAAYDLDDKHYDHSSIWESPAAMNINAGHLRAAVRALHQSPNTGDGK